MSFRFVLPAFAVATAFACSVGCSSSSDDSAAPAAAAPLRPGVEDSSQVYKGTPSPAENAFWDAVRSGNDSARADAVTQLEADIQKDPTNGYSEFLAGASTFMPSSDVLRALAAGTTLPTLPQPNGDGVPLFTEAMSNLTDPLYLGFDAAFLGTLQTFGGDPAGGAKTLALAQAKNPAASGFITATGKLRQRDVPGALASMYTLLEFCTGGPVDKEGADVAKYVARANGGTLAHRECYSGYHAMHATEGLLLLIGDIHMLAGDAPAAGRYYAALKSATNYASWPLKPLAERRISGKEAASGEKMNALTQCTTCHTQSIQ